MSASTSRAAIATAALLAAVLGCERPEAPSEEPPGEAVEPAPGEEPGEGTGEPTEPPPPEPASGPSRDRTVYVPAYSQIHAGRRPTLLSITLSVRNVDPTATVTLTHVDYYDTSGHRVRRYLEGSRALRPLETVEFRVETLDEVGGSGANFLVHWEGPSDAHPLLTETVMVGHAGNGYLSFSSRGVELERPMADGEEPLLEEPPPEEPLPEEPRPEEP